MKSRFVWSYDIEHDDSSLAEQKVADNDIPDLLEYWMEQAQERQVPAETRPAPSRLQKTDRPLKADRLRHDATIHRLRFEEVIADDGIAEKGKVAREQAEA